jgi:hypothetical protein
VVKISKQKLDLVKKTKIISSIKTELPIAQNAEHFIGIGFEVTL